MPLVNTLRTSSATPRDGRFLAYSSSGDVWVVPLSGQGSLGLMMETMKMIHEAQGKLADLIDASCQPSTTLVVVPHGTPLTGGVEVLPRSGKGVELNAALHA